MEFTLPLEILAILFAVAVVAGFLDTLAGGGGLITLPALLLTGMPPLLALATNKLQSCSGSGTATIAMLRMRMIDLSEVKAPFLASLAGSALGAVAVQFIDARALDVIIPAVLIGIALYFILAPKAGEVDGKPRMGRGLYRATVVPAIGLYDGMFGPGTGSFFSLAGVALRGQNLIKATASAKAFNFASNIAALAVFVLSGKVVWAAGFAMMCGQVLGASLGAMAVVRGGTKLIRPLIVTMCLVMVARYFWRYVA